MDLTTLTRKIIESAKMILTQPTVLFKNMTDEVLLTEHTVVERERSRPDLIALKYYGDASLTDILLKFNGISDPFSIMPGETIRVPLSTVPYEKMDRPGNVDETQAKMQFIETKRLSQKDQRRLDALKKKYNKEALLPPNVMPVGKKGYVFKQGRVIFGQQAQSDFAAGGLGTTNAATDTFQNAEKNINQLGIEESATAIKVVSVPSRVSGASGQTGVSIGNIEDLGKL
jgi:hypothetical protein